MLDRAEAAAIRAALDAGVEVRPADSVVEVAAVRSMLGEIWADPQHVVPRELLRAVGHFGGVLLGAWDGDDCVGASLGFFGATADGFRLHSHSTGVATTHRGRHVGLALKLAQRAVALRAGVDVVTWTFDPLLRANAAFNLERLGAIGTGYEPDFYGPRADVFNAGDLTDRLVVEWRVGEAHVQAKLERAAPATPAPGADDQVLLSVHDGVPRSVVQDLDPARPAWIPTPADAVTLRRRDPLLARTWRLLVRDAFRAALDGGWVVHGFAEEGWHRLDPGSCV